MTKITWFAMLGAAALTAGCGPAEADTFEPEGTTVGTVESGLSTAETDGLTFLREEEKLARDVYLTLAEQWGAPIFTNIAASEQQHMDSVAELLVRYRLVDPAAGLGVGEFQNATLQALYAQLVARGSVDLVGALTVGATIEDMDIVDLEHMKAATTHADLLRVYENLQKGSRNHLRSFVGQLVDLGETYVPQYLDQATFDAIVESEPETGRR